MQNLLNDLAELLKADERLVAEGRLVKNKIIELALQTDADLLKMLLQNETIKAHFFTEVKSSFEGGKGDVLVFDKIKFMRFVANKQFLPDSYTAYKNKVGLIKEGDYLDNYITKQNDVVLAWPYKDTVLQGGQTKEDDRRNEVFWNETLAPDQIDRLLYPKVLTNWKKFDKDGEHPVENFTGRENLIIKGNNLLALHSLKQRYAGKVKLIYIDPPYNTGNDSFMYNDSFNHSTWLTFMKNRLIIAKELLKNDGSIFISIDNKELSFLQVLMDEIFGVENRKNIITVKRGSVTGAKVINPGLVNISEYVIVYSKNPNAWKTNRIFKERERDTRYNTFITNYEDSPENWQFSSVLEAFANLYQVEKSKLKKVLKSKYEEKLNEFIFKNTERICRFASLDDSAISSKALEIKKQSKKDESKVFFHFREKNKPYYIFKGNIILFLEDRLIEIDGKKTFGEPVTDIWDDVLPNDLHNEGGVKMRKGKKPEKLIQRIIQMAGEKNDIFLDFFCGSGTSIAVAHKMQLKYIGIEQLDYIEDLPVERLKNVISGEQSGISKAVNWQGGGSFVFCELMQYNQKFIDQIMQAENTETLLSIWEDMRENAFLNYLFNSKRFDENIEAFKQLELEAQKKFLFELLDKNQLYLNYGEMEDANFTVSETDKKLNKLFYGKR